MIGEQTSLIGQTLRGYTFEKRIGRGGFGAVYLAWQTSIERAVAIKVILPHYANEPEFQQQFEAEAHLVASLEHPHIIPLYDYWQDETGAYLVMRYIPEGTLDDLIKKEKLLSWEQARRIFVQTVEALEVAHDNGVVHRDIKPANILLDDRGNAYLTDFGVAWIAGTITSEESVTGTPAYLSPELLRGQQPSPQSDLYALGILLYQMLTGQHPFTGHIAQIIFAQVNNPMPSVLDIRSDLPKDVETLIYRLTMKEANDRYPNAKTLRLEFENTAMTQPAAPMTTISVAAKNGGLQKSIRQHRASLDLRNRYSMIDVVYEYWIEGVLENLLSGYALLDLSLNLEAHYVPAGTDETGELTEAIASSAENISHLFESYGGKLLILGEPGVGKSTLLLALARDLLHQANDNTDHPIPVIFNLSSWSEKTSLATWMEHELQNKYQVPSAVARRWIQDDALLLLLDGLDEVNEAYRQHCLDEINGWRSEHPFVNMVVSSRLADYVTLPEQLNLNGAVVIQPLNDDQVTDYLTTIEGTSNIQRILQDNVEMRELSHSPLMLGVMIAAYEDHTIETLPDFTSVEEQHVYLFDRYVEHTWNRRLADKQFSLDQIRNGFSNLASKLVEHSRTMFFVEDLQPDWLPEASEQRFHLMSQLLTMAIFAMVWCGASILFLEPVEYVYYAVFGALWGWTLFYGIERFGTVKSLLLFVTLVSIFRITLDPSETVQTYFQKPLFRSTLPYTAIIGTLAYLYHRTGQSSRRIQSVDALFFSFSSTRWMGAVAGAVSGLAVSIPNILSNDFSPLEVFLKVAGIGLLAWLITGFRSNQVPLSAQINERITRSLRNGLSMGLVGGITVIMIVGIAFHPRGFSIDNGAPALFNFIPMFVTTFFIYGGMVALRHYLLRRQLVQHQVIPSHLIDLLKEGVQLGIMRRVGGGFIFIHRYLLEYFVGLDNKTLKD